jgi:flagellar assembly factor FliW
MKINTSRFGDIAVSASDEIVFPEGLLGFNELRRFVFVEDPKDEIFAWLQSCERPEVAFPVLEPELFAAGYQVKLTKHDLEQLKALSDKIIKCFTIVTIPDDPTQMTANMKAPVVVNIPQKIARQCVLQDNDLAIRDPIFARLQQRLTHGPGSSLQSRAAEWGMTLRVAENPDGTAAPTQI